MTIQFLFTGLACAGALAAFSAPANAADDHVSCTGEPNEITIVITNVRENVGIVTVDLYENDSSTFLERAGRVGRVRGAAKAPVTTLCLRAPTQGDFALALYHDKNANKKLDRGAFGIPSEPWGLSNDPKVTFGPPDVSAALFSVAESGVSVEVTLKGK